MESFPTNVTNKSIEKLLDDLTNLSEGESDPGEFEIENVESLSSSGNSDEYVFDCTPVPPTFKKQSRIDPKSKEISTPTSGDNYASKSGIVWTLVDPEYRADSPGGNISIKINEVPGPTMSAQIKITNSFTSAFSLFFDDYILHKIISCTETEARNQLGEEWPVSVPEFEAFISILLARGAYGAQNWELDELWSDTWGPPFFSQTMTRKKFRELMRFLRFDMKSTRRERLQTDKFALISDIWNRFITNCQSYYIPHENILIFEHLLPSRTRCPFIQYKPNKSEKCGIKFWLAVDSKTKYILNGVPCLGKDDISPNDQALKDSVVMKLMTPYLEKGRNVITDSYFTNLSLAQELLKFNTTIVGTINHNRGEIPDMLKKIKASVCGSNVFLHGDCTLTSYQIKRHKNILVLSTLHRHVNIDKGSNKKKPETVVFFNENKCGVEVLRKMIRTFSTKARNRRWPVHVFYNILDFAVINSWLLYRTVTEKNTSRKEFMFNLALELRQDYFNTRVIPKPPVKQMGAQEKVKKRRSCHVCVQNKTSIICSKCEKPICGICTAEKYVTCFKCIT